MARAEVTARSPAHDPYAVLRLPNFQRFTAARFLSSFGAQMLDVAIGWNLYVRTGSALALGFVGLVQVIPIILLSLPAGQIIDRSDRRSVAMRAQSVAALSALGLALIAYWNGPIGLIYLCLLLLGSARGFSFPALTALLSQTIPEELYASAVTWNSSIFQIAAILGPTLAGFAIGVTGHATIIFTLYVLMLIIVVALLATVKTRPVVFAARPRDLRALVDGWRFLWQNQIILSAITLDLFAVLLGGATTLLPIYALTILKVGPVGLGWMRAAPSVGAMLMAFAVAHRQDWRHAGRILLLAVAGFGLATIVFGISRWLPLTLVALFLLGAFDNISVVIRGSLLLLTTPDSMRGRVSAVSSLFVSTSNELGGFESGFAAALFGPMISVVAGGVGTILVVVLIGRIWPQLGRLQSLAPASEMG